MSGSNPDVRGPEQGDGGKSVDYGDLITQAKSPDKSSGYVDPFTEENWGKDPADIPGTTAHAAAEIARRAVEQAGGDDPFARPESGLPKTAAERGQEAYDRASNEYFEQKGRPDKTNDFDFRGHNAHAIGEAARAKELGAPPDPLHDPVEAQRRLDAEIARANSLADYQDQRDGQPKKTLGSRLRRIIGRG